ncbi:hypothetical protein BJY52DRAFT_1186402 [Lactarius psammicola]|nr:hypothetical protein BJY52DRAFT_1186402 [Lactarius psammicola]
MTPSTLQARIKAFEALGMGASKQVLDTVAIHSEPEHLLDSPLSPTAPSIPPIVPTVYTPSTSPGSLRQRSSLVDLKDWVIDDGPLRASSPTAVLNGYSPPKPFENAPLISFESSPPKLPKAPPLPPRQPSYNSLRSFSAPCNESNPHVDTNYLRPTTYDVLTAMRKPRVGPLHAFSIEREWSVAGTEDGESLDESFENVSAPSSFLPPITLPPRPPKPPGNPSVAMASKPPPPPLPPKLPQRQQRGSAASSLASRGSSPSSITSPALALTPSGSSSAPSLASTRRVPPPLPITSPPPPPPPRSRPASARTSVQSTATTVLGPLLAFFDHLSYLHLVPHVPLPVEEFEAGDEAVPPKPPPPIPAKRQNAGWRGLSMDLDQSAQSAPCAGTRA